MTKRIVAHEYDNQWNIKAFETFQYVEDAEAWCNARAGEVMEFGDTQIGLEGNTIKNIDSLTEHGDYAEGEPIFQISGIRNENPEEIDELFCFHYDPKKMSDEDLKYAWNEATHYIEDKNDDDWEIVVELEQEVNRRGLNQKGTTAEEQAEFDKKGQAQ